MDVISLIILIMITIIVVPLLFAIRPTQKDTQLVVEEAIRIARRLSTQDYFVCSNHRFWFEVTLHLEVADVERRKDSLSFTSRHPSFKQACRLSKLERVRFSFSESPHKRVSKEQVCAYLTLVDK